ncbi:methyltransferase family protein [Streptomyces canus]|uniref:methyltransferase family protein n=1 Tax=Streptomyces canus TaxID=58343 RepID=UPI00324871AD
MSLQDPITPEQLLQLGPGFMASKTLLRAVELEIFTVLGNGRRDRVSLMAEVGLHPRSSADFLDTLVSLNLLTRDADGNYRSTPAADVFLDRAKPSYVGGTLEMANARLSGFWNNLTNALQTGTLQNEVELEHRPGDDLSRSPTIRHPGGSSFCIRCPVSRVL